MFSTYLTLGRAAQQAVPALRWIDIDKGQLDNPKLYNSLAVPALLIGETELTWSQQADRHRLGEGTVVVKLIVRLPAQTHLTHPLVEANLRALDLADEVEAAILAVPGVTTVLSTVEYAVDTVYVVEQAYQVSYKTGPAYRRQPVQVLVNPFIHRPPQIP